MSEWYEKRNHKLLLAFLLNAAVLLFFMLLYYPVYETNDDNAIMGLASGTYGVYDAHLIYQNYILGFFITHLYQLKASVPWYALMQYALMFVSFTALTYVFMDYLEKPDFLWIFILILLFFGFEGYVKIQYTKTAGIIAVAGLALIFLSLILKKISWLRLIVGVFLVWAGSLYRVQEFFCVFAIFTTILIFMILSRNEICKGEVLKRAGITALSCVILMGLVIASVKYDSSQYQSESWTSYLKYNDLRTELLDYGFPRYKDRSEDYDKIGLDLTAIKMLRRWTFEDDDRFNTEVFQKIIEIKGDEKPVINKSYIKGFIISLYSGLLKRQVFWCFLLMFICCILWSRHSLSKWIPIAYMAFVLLAIYAYLYYRGRFMVRRVDVGIWMAAIAVLIIVFKPEKLRFCLGTGIIVLLASTVFLNYHCRDMWRINSEKKIKNKNNEQKWFKEVHQDKDHLYLRKVDTISLSSSYGVFEQSPFGIADNIYAIGGWPAHTETARQVLDKYNVGNPFCFRYMINNDNIYLIDNNIDLTLSYLRRWYDETADAKEIRKVGKYRIYSIYSKGNK